MHPLIRLLCLLVLAALLPTLAPLALVLLLMVLLMLLLRIPTAARLWLQGLLRLKWLFLALFVLYLGYTPGQPLWSALPGLSVEGLTEGSRRAGILAALLAAVQILLRLTSTAQLVEALRQLLRPLAWVGISGERFALRLGLVLAGVGQMQQRLERSRADAAQPLNAAAALVLELEREPVTVDLLPGMARLAPPPAWEFFLPLVLAVLLWCGR